MSEKESTHCQNGEFVPTSSMTSLKRKSQHEMAPSCSKEKRASDDAKTPIEFDDMCDDAIDIILCYLQLEDLANISDTSTRLKNIAGSVFLRRYGHRLIAFDTFYHSQLLSEKEINCIVNFDYCWKKKSIVSIRDAKTCFKVIRNFGEFIRFMRVYCFKRGTSDFPIAYIGKYIHDYCTESLEALELLAYPFKLNKSIETLQEFYYICRPDTYNEDMEALELIPNLRSLHLLYVPKTLKRYFPQLERVQLSLTTSVVEVDHFISFLQLNQQIKYLRLTTSFANYNDVMLSSIEKNLTQLKSFKFFNSNLRDNISTTEAIYRFKTVESFSISHPKSFSFEFDHLKRFFFDDYFISIGCLSTVLSNKNLKVFKFRMLRRYAENERIIRTLVRGLPDLEEIIVVKDRQETLLMLKNILGTQWEQIEIKDVSMYLIQEKGSWFKSKFKRIQKKSEYY